MACTHRCLLADVCCCLGLVVHACAVRAGELAAQPAGCLVVYRSCKPRDDPPNPAAIAKPQ